MSNYATESDTKNVTGDDTSDFTKRTGLASLKSDLGKLDLDKLQTATIDLSKLRNVVENDVVKKTVYDELVKKFNAIDPSKLITKIDYDSKFKKIEKKIPNHDKYITTNEFIKFYGEMSDKKLKQAKLPT